MVGERCTIFRIMRCRELDRYQPRARFGSESPIQCPRAGLTVQIKRTTWACERGVGNREALKGVRKRSSWCAPQEVGKSETQDLERLRGAAGADTQSPNRSTWFRKLQSTNP